jgi:hypothetical protein
MRRFVGLIGLVSLALIGPAAPAMAVLYGQPDSGAHPYVGVVRFFYADGTYVHRCSGTLISPTVFLTAGHCTDGTASAEVWFTETAPSTQDVLSGDYEHGVTGTPYTYPGFDFTSSLDTGDVGVVVLDEPVELPSYGQLPSVDEVATLDTHQLLTIVGYGIQDVRPVEVADMIRLTGTVKLVNAKSGYSGGFNLHLSSNNGVPHRGGTCFGDSGGPVLYGDTVLAVNSFVINGNCAGAGYSFRIDRPEILAWIESFL